MNVIASLIKITLQYLMNVGKILRSPDLRWPQKLATIPAYTAVFVIDVIVSTAILWIIIAGLFLFLKLVGF